MKVGLRNGRFLKVAEYGDPTGRPIFYNHGFPGSRIEAKLGHEAALANNARLLAVDRPGMGGSCFYYGRRITDWPDDLAEVADHFGYEKFSIAGVSGGSPYALACAHQIPERLEHVGIIAGVAPRNWAWGNFELFNRAGLRMASWGPATGALLARYLSRKGSRSVDCAVMAESWATSFANGPLGPGTDLTLLGSDWEFNLEDIAIPVKLWHGDVDCVVPPEMTVHMEDTIPRATATYYEDEDHHTIIVNRLAEILGEL